MHARLPTHPGQTFNRTSSRTGAFRANGYLRGSVGEHKLVCWLSRDSNDGCGIYDVYQLNAVNSERGYDVDSVGLKHGFDFSPELSLSLLTAEGDSISAPGVLLCRFFPFGKPSFRRRPCAKPACYRMSRTLSKRCNGADGMGLRHAEERQRVEFRCKRFLHVTVFTGEHQ